MGPLAETSLANSLLAAITLPSHSATCSCSNDMWIPNNQPFIPFISSLISSSHCRLPGHPPIYKLISSSSHLTFHPVFHYLSSAMNPTTEGLTHGRISLIPPSPGILCRRHPAGWFATAQWRYHLGDRDEMWCRRDERKHKEDVRMNW